MVILTTMNRNHKYILSNEEIINLFNKYRNFILYNYKNYYSEYKKFKDYYIKYTYFLSNLKNITYFNYSGKLHREDGHAWIEYYDSGKIDYKLYYLNGKEYSYKNYILEIKKLV